MEERKITGSLIHAFEKCLWDEEKSRHTIKKYIRDIEDFMLFLSGRPVTKETVLIYKKMLIGQYAPRSVNSKLASLCSLFAFCDWEDCKVKSLKLQREIYAKEDRELSRQEYCRLVAAASSNQRLKLILQTICGTGIRISELTYFTINAIQRGSVTVSCKNKTREVFIPSKLRKMLLQYAKKRGITSGVIFCTRSGKPLDRSNIWADMKRLCKKAGVNPSKVFPHNLRKLFARTFYEFKKDIAKLADVLGHSSIETTRIYIMATGKDHRRYIDHLNLIL